MFQIVFYRTRSGNEVVRDFLRQLPVADKKKVGEDLMTVQIGYPMGLPLCRPLGDGLLEVRTSLPSRREVESCSRSTVLDSASWRFMRSSKRASKRLSLTSIWREAARTSSP